MTNMVHRTESATEIEPILVVDDWVWLRRNIEEFTFVDPDTEPDTEATAQQMWRAEEVTYRLKAGEEPPTPEMFNRVWLEKTEDNSVQAQIDDLNNAVMELASLL